MDCTGRPKKIYIMTVAASGKSTFAAKHAYYGGYKVVDFAQRMPRSSGIVKLMLFIARVIPRAGRLVRNTDFVKAKGRDRYHQAIFQYLRTETEPVAVLGRRAPEDLRPYADVAFGVVLIPWDDHRRNCERRRRSAKNPLPFFHHWTTDVERIKRARHELLDYAGRHQLAVFESFSSAIARLSKAT